MNASFPPSIEDFDLKLIMKILPHRYPFLLVDRILGLEFPPGSKKGGLRVGRKVKAQKNVSYNEPFFPGHFPGRPVMPGVLQIEALAQASALGCIDNFGEEDVEILMLGINNAKFRRLVVPGDTLILNTEVLKERQNILRVATFAQVEGVTVCEAEIMARLVTSL